MPSKTISDIRHANLEKLIATFGSAAELNRRLGRAPEDTTIKVIRRRVLLKSGKTRSMGNLLARTIEEKLGLTKGWMDTDHSQDIDYFEESKQILESVHAFQIIPLPGTETFTKAAVYLDGTGFQNEFPGRKVMEFRAGIVGNDTLAPRIKRGDRLLIDITVHNYTTDGIYVIKILDTYALREIILRIDGKYKLFADSRQQDELLLSDLSSLTIVGRVVYGWSGRHL